MGENSDLRTGYIFPQLPFILNGEILVTVAFPVLCMTGTYIIPTHIFMSWVWTHK